MSGRRSTVLAVSVLLALPALSSCGDTEPSESPLPSSSSSTTLETYHGDFEGRDEAGTAGGDANPDAEHDD